MSPPTVQISVNGNPKEIAPGTTVAGLLELLKIERAQVAVEVNAAVVKKARHAEHALQQGDQVEIVTFVGGG